MIAQDYLAGIDPVYWQFWIGFFLVVIVLFARGGILGGLDALSARLRAKPSDARMTRTRCAPRGCRSAGAHSTRTATSR